MREIDPLISEYSHEKHRSREAEALFTLRKVASLVKPIMRARSWRVGTLSEFYPSQQNLLGLNVNAGQKILLRLRYPGDANQFLPLEQVVDTMLHELCHIVFGPHDGKFNALWTQLRDEYQGLLHKGYTGEGFLSEGKKLGGKRVPRDEARRLASNAAEKRRVLSSGSGQRLGGARVPVGTDMRNEIAGAVEKRLNITKGCGSGDNKNAEEIKAISDEAATNGFRTKAEEDQANEVAIAQALWELGQEDEREKYGGYYESPSAANPFGSNGLSHPTTISSSEPQAAPPSRNPGVAKVSTDQGRRGDVSRPIYPIVNSKTSPPATNKNMTAMNSSQVEPRSEPFWACSTCTCHNPLNFLICDACGVERPSDSVPQTFNATAGSRQAATWTKPKPAPAKPKTWTCQNCTMIMEDQWWICSQCETMKSSS